MPQAETTQTEAAQPHATGSGLQTVVAIFGMSMFAMVVGTALYGPPENSERAFRLLHWWKRDPEPIPEAPTPPGQRRSQRTKR
ncbi:hypothetical protein [Streptomyces cavernae]|uniref:hypothetical protein n=1 Tax=Streptomyces cavernae TaxID=2259034 RepID=UPI000FEB911C|nr:hypothetical protein [Streptomyces cavernae]